MKQNCILLILIGGLILVVYLNHKYNKKSIEGFVDVDRERFSNEKENLCINFDKQCVNQNNQECEDTGIVACQKYKLKCETRCRTKKIDDSGKTQDNLDKCMKTCQQVKSDCCARLNNLGQN